MKLVTLIRQNILFLERSVEREFPLPSWERVRVRGRCKSWSPSPHSSPVKGEDVSNLTDGEKSTHVSLLSAASADVHPRAVAKSTNVATGLTASLVILIMLSLPAPDAHAQAGGKWVRLAPFPEPAEELYGIAAGGKMYVFGGLAPGWKPRGLAYEYDPATNKWTKKKPMALASHHVAFAELNGKIYAFGGFVPPTSGPPAWIPIDNAWEYDPANDNWKGLAPMPTKRGSPVAAVVGGKIYVIGGASTHPGSSEPAVHPARPHRALSTVEEYDPATNAWRARSPMPTARNHAAIGAVNNKIYVIGGRIGAAFVSVSSPTDVVEEYDPATDLWGTIKARMPTPRSAVAWGVHGGRIYVAGGEVQGPQFMAAFRALEAYEPATNRWVSLPAMPIPRHGLAGGVVGNRLHLVSGDVQSAGIADMRLHSESHDAFEFAER